jgi:hypothetical protein
MSAQNFFTQKNLSGQSKSVKHGIAALSHRKNNIIK